MEKLTDEEIGKEFKILWKNKFNILQKREIIKSIRGYFDRGSRANKLIKSLEE